MYRSFRISILWISLWVVPMILHGQSLRNGMTTPLVKSGTLVAYGEGRIVQIFGSKNKAQGAYVAGISSEVLQLQVFDAQQKIKWVADVPHVHDTHFPSVAIAQERAVLVYPETALATFYHNNGEVIVRKYLFDNSATHPELEKAAHVAIHPETGNVVIAAMQKATYDVKETGNLQVFVFNEVGELLHHNVLPLPAIESLKVSEDGKAIQIRIYGQQGREMVVEEIQVDGMGTILQANRSHYAIPETMQRAADITFPYPVKPFNEAHPVTGAFGEYRGPTSGHFHNGTDIPEPDGTPVYAVVDATVTGRSDTGVNAYIRAGNYVYVHIIPNPNLPIGSAVKAGETILGTIITGQGHVHFSEGPPGNYTNAIRPTGGFSPFVDTWKPTISDIRFQHAESGQVLQANGLTGKIKITFRVQDPIGPSSGSAATQNNGAYLVGYDVRKADRTTIVHSPTPDGIVFRFDGVPSDDYVHFVYDQTQSSNSSHVYIVTNTTTANSAWDSAKLPDGAYSVRLFARDTRGNEDVVFMDVQVAQRDVVPPPAPVLIGAIQNGGIPDLRWAQTSVSDLAGFRLFAADSPFATGRQLADEKQLLGTTNNMVTTTGKTTQYYYLTSVDTATPPNISIQSDVYGMAPFTRNKKVLVVDGFDRFGGSGSWSKPFHVSAGIYGQAIDRNGLGFETVANEAVLAGLVDLKQYDAVMWVLGDESTSDETFSDAEQVLVRAYLEHGGRLFLSGSEVAWDLGAKGTATDQTFFGQFLKATYVGDNAASYNVRGMTGTLAEGLVFRYGASPYTEDYPDFINPVNGGQAILQYDNGRTAAVAYNGLFGTATKAGKMIYFAFPFDTIDTLENRREVFRRVLSYLLDEAIVGREAEVLPSERLMVEAFPNPFSDTALVKYHVEHATDLSITVYDLLGRKVQTLFHAPVSAGSHQMEWQAEHLANGLYIIEVQTETGHKKIRLTLMR